MKPIRPLYAQESIRCKKFAYIATVMVILLNCFQANAKFRFEGNDSINVIASEKKVDYLEKIYFSGGDKESLDQQILVAIQDIQGKMVTPSLTKQLTFLLEVQPKVSEVNSTCDALDLLAVGIYNVDAAEAAQQGVKMPSNKAKEKSVDAIGALNNLSNTAYNTSSSATTLAWSSIINSNGKYTSVADKAGKVAKTAGTIGAAAGAVGQAAKTGKEVIDLGKKFGIGFGGKKKKTCDDVPQKEIVLGEHISMPDVSKVINTNAATSANNSIVAGSVKQETPPTIKTFQSKITLKAVSASQLQTILSAITKIPGVTTAESDSFSKNVAVLIIDGELKVGDLANKISEACKPLKLNVDSYSNSASTADLTLKP